MHRIFSLQSPRNTIICSRAMRRVGVFSCSQKFTGLRSVWNRYINLKIRGTTSGFGYIYIYIYIYMLAYSLHVHLESYVYLIRKQVSISKSLWVDRLQSFLVS